MKKIISIILSVVMMLVLSSCQTSKENEAIAALDFEIGDTGGLFVPFGNGEELRLAAIDETNSHTNYIFDKLEQITGVNIKLELIPVASRDERTQVILASGNLPDIMGYNIGSIETINDYANQGAFESVNDHLDEMPNFKKLFGEGTDYDWIFKSYAAEDGKLYMLPIYEMQRAVNHGMLYRKDIFDKLGIEMWDSPESFYNALKALKKEYPDSYPLTSKTAANILVNYSTGWGITAYDVYYDEAEKVWKYADTDPNMKNMLDFFHKLYKEGLLDPEFLTNTQASWTSKMTNGKSFVTFDWIGRLDQFPAQSEIEGFDLRYGNPAGPTQQIFQLSKLDLGGVVAKNKNSALSMKLMDFLYSDAGAELMTCGVRGETFEIDESGMASYLEFDKDKKVEITDLIEKYGMWIQGTYTRVDRRSGYFKFTEREQEAQKWPETHGGFAPEDPRVTFVGDDISRVAELKNALIPEFETVMFKYIIGEDTGDEAWNKWLKKAEKLGFEELVKLYNERHKELGL